MSLQEFINSHPSWFVVIFACFFVATWCLVVAVISVVGGWFHLSKRFRLDRPFDGLSEGLQSGVMRSFAKYANCLRLGANAEGLYLAVLFLFRFMHPPLFVPWSEIKVHRQQRWLFGEYFTLMLGSHPAIPLRITNASATLLKDAAGVHWPKETGAFSSV